MYLMTFAGAAGSTFGLTSSTPLVKPLLSVPGAVSVGRNVLLTGGPAIAGFLFGVAAFGNG